MVLMISYTWDETRESEVESISGHRLNIFFHIPGNSRR